MPVWPATLPGAMVLSTRSTRVSPATLHLDTDLDRPVVAGKAVHHRVLHQRLQDEARHPGRAAAPRARRYRDGEPVREALLLQLQVQGDELQLIRQA